MTSVHLTRVRRAGVKNQVFEQLRDRIMERTWLPGAKIPSENALAVALGVSRVSIREALQMLATLGLLETRQGGGTTVREYSGEIFFTPLLPMLALDTPDILHVLEYRKIVEKGIVSLVVKRVGNAEIEELEEVFRSMEGHNSLLHDFSVFEDVEDVRRVEGEHGKQGIEEDLPGVFAHVRAPAVPCLQQPEGRQHLQGLPDRDAAHSQRHGQGVLRGNLRAGRPGPLHDAVPELLEDLIFYAGAPHAGQGHPGH